MATLIINQEEVRRLLKMGECIDLMEQTFATLARGDAVQPLRTATWMPDRKGLLGTMPGFLGRPRTLGIKVVTVFPGNHGTEFDAHQGAVLLFDVSNGSLLAIVDASEITSIRTAAASAAATRCLAREDASTLAILGSGTQARTHLEAMRLVRDLRQVRVWSRSHQHARRFAAGVARGLHVQAVPTAREAVEGADIICTVTASREPVLCGEWISPGAHINAVGACLASMRELDGQAVARSRLFVDRRESTVNEAGDFLLAKEEGVIGDEHILGELGEVLLGQVEGRRDPNDITLFESQGLAVEDLAAAGRVHQRAVHEKAGTTVTVGGRRHETA